MSVTGKRTSTKLSLPRKNVSRFTDWLDMTLIVLTGGHKTANSQMNSPCHRKNYFILKEKNCGLLRILCTFPIRLTLICITSKTWNPPVEKIRRVFDGN